MNFIAIQLVAEYSTQPHLEQGDLPDYNVIGATMFRSHNLTPLNILFAFAVALVACGSDVSTDDASPTSSIELSQQPAQDDEVTDHQDSLSDPTMAQRQVEFLESFQASNADAFSLPRTSPILDGFGGAVSLDELRSDATAIAVGTVNAQTFHGKVGEIGIVSQFWCYSVLTVRETQILDGDLGQEVTVVSPGCPTLQGDMPVFLEYPSDPPLQPGREYVLFLTAGDDAEYETSAFPEGHQEAGTHYHLGDPAAQYEVVDGKLLGNDFTPPWARSIDGATLDAFKSYLDDPSTVPAPPPAPTHDSKDSS